MRFGVVLLAAWALTACDDKPERTEAPTDKPPPGALDASAPRRTDAGPDSGGAVEPARADAGLDAGLRVLPSLGLNVLPARASADAGALEGSDALLADLALLALQVRATHFSYPAMGLDAAAVAERVARFAEIGTSVAVQLEVISRDSATGEPTAVNSAKVVGVVQELFARNLAADYLLFGGGLEVHWGSLRGAARAEFEQQVSGLMEAARTDPRRPSGLRVGYSARFETLREHPSLFGRWNDVAEVVGVNWFVLEPGLTELDSSKAQAVIDGFLGGVARAGLPVVLQQVAFPSRLRGASQLASQATFHYQLLKALALSGDRVPFAAISSLDDPTEADCALQAADLGMSGDEAFTEALCSIGLRSPGFVKKPSYSAVIEGLARFSGP